MESPPYPGGQSRGSSLLGGSPLFIAPPPVDSLLASFHFLKFCPPRRRPLRGTLSADARRRRSALGNRQPHASSVFPSPKLVRDALDRASPDAERLGDL